MVGARNVERVGAQANMPQPGACKIQWPPAPRRATYRGGMASERAKKAALTEALQSMFRRLKARPAPERLLSVVDQLDAPARPPPETVGG